MARPFSTAPLIKRQFLAIFFKREFARIFFPHVAFLAIFGS
jgi:hypothetical protein